MRQDTNNASRCRQRREQVCRERRIRTGTKQPLKQKQQQSRPKQKRSLCDISMRVRVVLCVGWWLCFSACNLKKDYLVLCLLCLLIGIETDMGTEEETGVRQQMDSRIRQETGRKIKKRRESRGEEEAGALSFFLLLLFCSLHYPLYCLLLCPRKRRIKKGYVLLPVTLPAGCEGASFPPDGTHST